MLVLTFGGRRSILDEPLCWVEEYPIVWREPRLNLAELAKLRWIEGWDRKRLANHFGRTEEAIQNYFQKIKKAGFNLPNLTVEELRRIKLNVQSTR